MEENFYVHVTCEIKQKFPLPSYGGGNFVFSTQNFPSIGGKILCHYPLKIFPPWEESIFFGM